MKKRTKILTVISSLSLSGLTLLTLASCGVTSEVDTLKFADLQDPYISTVAPNNPTFSDASNTVFFQSIYTSLVSWKTEGEYTFDPTTGDIIDTPKSDLVLEAANSIKIKNGSTVSYSLDRSTTKTGIIEQANAKTALTTATQVEFTLNPNMKWVDSKGNVKQNLVPYDFWCGLVSYFNSSKYGLNSNDYFMTYAGIDYTSTINNPANKSTTPGDPFVFHIGSSKSPYFLDILTKQYFYPVPYSHPEVKPTIFSESEVPSEGGSLGPIVFTKSSSSRIVIDKNKTNWNQIFGAGLQQQTNPDSWYAGGYYLEKTSLQDIVFKRNDIFFDANKEVYGPKETKIPRVVEAYGNTFGTHEKIFRSYTTGDLNYVKVQSEQTVEAYTKYRNSSQFHLTGLAKQKQTRLPSYNTQIYNTDGSLKSRISPVYGKFIEKWNTDGLAIRKAINGAINYAKLAEIVWKPGKYDFIMSVVPYGNLQVELSDGSFASQYQAIANGLTSKDGSKVTGALATPFQDMLKSDSYVLSSSGAINLINEMNKALDAIGATVENPLKLDYLTLIREYPVAQVKYNEELIAAIREMSKGRIILNLIPRTAQSTDDIFYNQNGPMGTFLWSADYSGSGTFMGFYFSLKYDTTTNKPLEFPNEPAGDLTDNMVAPYFVPTLWKPLFEDIKKSTTGSWLYELQKHLIDFGVFTRSGVTLGNLQESDLKEVNAGTLDKQIGIWSDLNLKNGLNLAQWIDQQYTFIPGIQEGLDYRGVELYPDVFKIVHSLNSDENFRDYIYYKK